MNCTHTLQKASKELCDLVLRSSQEKVRNLQHEMQTTREKLFEELGHARATNTWNHLRQENFTLRHSLKLLEERKFKKTIPTANLDPQLLNQTPYVLEADGTTKLREFLENDYVSVEDVKNLEQPPMPTPNISIPSIYRT